MSKRIPFDTKPEESSIVNRIILMQKAGCKAAIFCSKNTCSDNPPTAGWYNILYWGMASEQIILASCTWQPKTTYYGVFNLDETAPTITWREVVTKSDLNAKTPTCQERHMTADTQTLSSDSTTTLYDSEITIPFDCIMIGNWKVLCKSSDANASFYYMVNNAYVQGRAQWDGTVQTDNTVNIFVMNRFTKGQKLSVSVQGNCSVRGNNTSLTQYTFTFIPV